MIRRGVTAIAVVAALGLAACGDDEETPAVDDAVEEATDAVDEALPDEVPADADGEGDPATSGDNEGLVAGNPCPDAGSPPNITGVTVYDELSCDEAAAALDEIGAVSKQFVLEPFSCGRISGGEFGGTWECADFDGRYFQFDFAD